MAAAGRERLATQPARSPRGIAVVRDRIDVVVHRTGMLLSARIIRLLLEAADHQGIATGPLLAAVHLDRAWFAVDGHRISWDNVVRLCEELSSAVEGDVERLRAIGRAMNHAPSYATLRTLARSMVTVRALYEVAGRWVAPANFPHLRLVTTFGRRGRLTIQGSIPRSHQGSRAFMEISLGSIASLPMLVGLPPCQVLEARVDTHSLHLELQMPADRSVVATGLRMVTGLVRRSQRIETLEQQRRALHEGLDASQRARDELRTVLERLPDPVVIHIDGRIAFANRAFVRTLGWPSADDLVGRALIDSVDPRSRALFAARMATPADVPEVPELTEAWLTTFDGTPVLVEVVPAQAVLFDGLPARLVVGRDVAERDRLKQRLATADRLASLGLLAAGVAHEVNNPLAYVLNNIEIARRQLAGLGPNAEVARDALDVALEGVDRIRFIVRELLFLARAESTPVAPTDLVSAVESTLALARIEIARTAKLVVELDAVAPVRGSVPRIAQIVLNLVLNALEAMSEGDPEHNELTVRVRRAGEAHVLLEIGDTGVGVSAKDEAKLFDPFFTTKAEGRGTGLGLTITQRLVAELGGDISFSSGADRGTTFRVLFALFDDDRTPRARTQPPNPDPPPSDGHLR